LPTKLFASIAYFSQANPAKRTWKDLNLNNNFTVNFWLQMSAYPFSYGDALTSPEDYLQSGFRSGIQGAESGPAQFGKLFFWNSQSGGTFEIFSTEKIPLNRPVNITLTVSPSTTIHPNGVIASMYIDGKLDNFKTGLFWSPSAVYINSFSVGGGVGQECLLFTHDFHDEALTDWQIANRYNQYASRFGVPRILDIDTLFLNSTQISALDLTKFSSLSTIGFTGLTNLRTLNLPDPCKFASTSFTLGNTQVTTLNLSSLVNVNSLTFSNNSNLSSLYLQGLTGITVFSTSSNNISTLNITSLSSLATLTITEPTLTSLVKNNSYNSLVNVT
jgi:hypothetical protein